jgi:hypothetical protein
VQYLNDGLCMSEGNDLCKEQYFNVSDSPIQACFVLNEEKTV